MEWLSQLLQQQFRQQRHQWKCRDNWWIQCREDKESGKENKEDELEEAKALAGGEGKTIWVIAKWKDIAERLYMHALSSERDYGSK